MRRDTARATLIAVLLAVGVGASACAAGAATAAGAGSPRPEDLIQPTALARQLARPAAERPELFQVGFKVLYRTGHLEGSRYVGPGSKPEGIRALRQALRNVPRGKAVVLYCGCCPWRDCPNVKPAFRAARAMGMANVKVLYIAKNLQHDWIDQGLPFREGD